MVEIIAEIGICHDGDYGKAVTMIGEAAQAGADAVKFQLYRADQLEPVGERRDILRKCELSQKEIAMLKTKAEESGLELLCTAFDEESLLFLGLELKVNRLKLASGCHKNKRLLKVAYGLGKPVLLSTGMMSWDDINRSMFEFPSGDITVMHCTSAYPCPDESVNLRVIPEIVRRYGKAGFSDHSLGIAAPIGAVALGATVIEKHFTLNSNAEGPDHACSLEPDEFAEMVANIRKVEAQLGNPEKRVQYSENPTIDVMKEREAWQSRS